MRHLHLTVLERSMRSGYAGVGNHLLTDPKTAMLFGDAKASITEVSGQLKALVPEPVAA